MAKREFTVTNEYHYTQTGAIRWIISHLLRYKTYMFCFFVGLSLAAACYSAISNTIGIAFDLVLQPNPDPAQLLFIALTILGFILVQGLTDMGGNFAIEVVAQRLERDARDELYISLLGKSQTFHNRQRIGDIMARAANDVRQLNPMMNPGVSLIFDALMNIVMPLIFISFLHPALLLSPLLFIVVFGIALRHYTRQLNPIAAKMQHQFGEMNANLAETILGIETVKAAAQEAQEKRKFVASAKLYRDYFVQEGQVQARYLPPLLLAITLAMAFLHGLYLFSLGQITTGDLVAYMALMGILRFPTFISIFTFSLVQLGLAGADRILTLLKEETELDENEAGYSHTMRGEIVFDHVTFSFDNKPILKNISFRAEPGQTVAIVGQTGSGKSIMTSLVNRIYDIDSGRVLIDNIDVRDWNLAALRSQISIIEQDIFLFSRTVAANIAFGLGQQATPQALQQAAKEAQAHDFIMAFKDGYETVIGERGVTLSGGQRQRLAIARALLTAPNILILDDSTSAIDSATEDEIQKAIKRVSQNRTTLLITHRLSQIRWANKILVLKRGEIIDQGSHAELMDRCEMYQRIFAKYET